MCSLYSVTKSQAAIREAARAVVDHIGNLPPLPGAFLDYSAPIVRNGLERARTGEGLLGHAAAAVEGARSFAPIAR